MKEKISLTVSIFWYRTCFFSFPHLCPRLRPQYLLPRNPPVNVDEIEPVRDDVRADLGAPLGDEQVVESLVPEEAAREEGAGGHGAQEGGVPVGQGMGQ